MATRGICVRETECNLAVSGNGADITYQVAITDPAMPPVFMGAIIAEIKVNLTSTDTITSYENKIKAAMQAIANANGFTISTYVLPTYKVA